ncbi:MAG TPA: hypothetical protein VFQ00_07940 [Terriglobales bacterium]|nr:hypothetical protein [Terriglobales bacterium]
MLKKTGVGIRFRNMSSDDCPSWDKDTSFVPRLRRSTSSRSDPMPPGMG